MSEHDARLVTRSFKGSSGFEAVHMRPLALLNANGSSSDNAREGAGPKGLSKLAQRKSSADLTACVMLTGDPAGPAEYGI